MEPNVTADAAASLSIPADQPVHRVQVKETLGDILDAKINLLENEPVGETETVAGTTRFEKIREAGSRVFAKFGVRRKAASPGPGMGPETPLGSNLGPDQAGGGPQTGEPRDPAVVRRSIASIGKALRKFGDKVIFRKALEATGDKEYAKQLTEETSATNDECDALGEVTDILLKELGIDSKYLPLTASLVVVAGSGTRYYLANKNLNQQLAHKHAKEDIKP